MKRPEHEPEHTQGKSHQQHHEPEKRRNPACRTPKKRHLFQVDALLFEMIAEERDGDDNIEHELHGNIDEKGIACSLKQDERGHDQSSEHPGEQVEEFDFMEHPLHRLSLKSVERSQIREPCCISIIT
jgi:hypothetical protein